MQSQLASYVPLLNKQVFTFQVGNQPGVLNPKPAVEMVQVRFICAHPTSMAVTPVYKLAAGAPPCTLPQHHKQLVSVVGSFCEAVIAWGAGPLCPEITMPVKYSLVTGIPGHLHWFLPTPLGQAGPILGINSALGLHNVPW